MNENIKAFLEKVTEDQELQAKLSEIRDPDEAYALASSVQGGFTKEEFVTEMTKIKEAMDENLSEADLAKSAGGMSDDEQLLISGTVLISVGTATCAAASAML